ncbi:MAG: hypothetical protein LBN39_11200 [Planctomycetaceae bacterium]|jgi:hypothetical protein|nr:hypothetical protein [Planctomycetaceae bacterium]
MPQFIVKVPKRNAASFVDVLKHISYVTIETFEKPTRTAKQVTKPKRKLTAVEREKLRVKRDIQEGIREANAITAGLKPNPETLGEFLAELRDSSNSKV